MIEIEFEYDFENRMSAPEYTPADEEIENSLRPKQLIDYVGQERQRKIFRFILKPQNSVANHSTMFCSMVRRDLAKPLLQELLQMRWALTFVLLQVLRLKNKAIWLLFFQILNKAMSFLLMKFTDLTERLRKSSIQRWKTARLILSSAKDRVQEAIN